MEIWRYRLSRGKDHGQHQSNITQSFGFCRNIKKISIISINSHTNFYLELINSENKLLKNGISHSPTFVLICKKKFPFFLNMIGIHFYCILLPFYGHVIYMDNVFLNMKFSIMQCITYNVFHLHIHKVIILFYYQTKFFHI